jgi:hypothetical protein
MMKANQEREATRTRREAVRDAYLQRRPTLLRGERWGMWCLVVTGFVGLIFVLPMMFRMSGWNLRFAIGVIDWSGFEAFRSSVWKWVRGGDRGAAIFWLFGIAHGVLVWHWLAELQGWRRILSGKRLLGASFAYSLMAILGIACVAASDEFYAEEAGLTIFFPIIFMVITAVLWHLRTLADDYAPDIDPLE